MDQLRADIRLKDTQTKLEVPKLLVAALLAFAAFVGATFGWGGYILGQMSHH